MRNIALSLFIAAAALQASAAVAFTSTGSGSQSTRPQTDSSFLNGTLVGWRGESLLTSVGRFDTAGAFIEDRRGTRQRDFDPAARPVQVQLEFRSQRLYRAVLY